MAKETPWTTKEALQHLQLRMEAFILSKAIFYGLKGMMAARKRLERLALRERVMNGEKVVQVVPMQPYPPAASKQF